MAEKILGFYRTRTGKIVCFFLVLFLFATSAYGTAVSVVNFPMLMGMVQKMVTQAITDKIKSVWNDEVKVKLEPGSINTKAVSFIKYNMTSYTNKMISQYMKTSVGAFSRSDGRYFAEAAKSRTQLSIPLPDQGFGDFQKRVREVSILLAGPPGGGPERMKHFTTSEFAAVKLRDAFNQASVAAYERAAGGLYTAEKFRSELSSFDPGRIDGAKSDQAVKDLAKLTYYNAMLQSEMLAVMSQGEIRHALEGR